MVRERKRLLDYIEKKLLPNAENLFSDAKIIVGLCNAEKWCDNQHTAWCAFEKMFPVSFPTDTQKCIANTTILDIACWQSGRLVQYFLRLALGLFTREDNKYNSSKHTSRSTNYIWLTQLKTISDYIHWIKDYSGNTTKLHSQKWTTN
jgi:hypothetical protein